MFNRDLPPPTNRTAPSEAEMAYVRALLLPLELKCPPSTKQKPRRIFTRRENIRLSDQQLLAEFQKNGAPGILIRLAQKRLTDHSPNT